MQPSHQRAWAGEQSFGSERRPWRVEKVVFVSVTAVSRSKTYPLPFPAVGGVLPWSIIYRPPRDLSQDPSPINTEQLVITSVQLLYFYDMDDPALSLATPVWMVRGSTPENTAHYVAYLDATR